MKMIWISGVSLVTLLGGALFHVKYQVVQLADQLQQVQKKKRDTVQTLHLLKAEWACLNEPERLETLAKKYLDLKPTESSQMISMNDLGIEWQPKEAIR
jgi:cell division protein FtsL